MQQSHVAPKKEARRSRVEERYAGIEKTDFLRRCMITQEVEKEEEDTEGDASKNIYFSI